MCGIVGYVGKDQAAPILLEGLTKLEYRGYDSAGIAVRDGKNAPVTVKEKGRIADLKDKIGPVESIVGTCGIGHTRWATHGAPSETNAHPHHSDDDAVIGVHNGIIENYEEIRDKLKRNGYRFYSQTDTKSMAKAPFVPSPAPSCACVAPMHCASCSRTIPVRSSARATEAR